MRQDSYDYRSMIAKVGKTNVVVYTMNSLDHYIVMSACAGTQTNYSDQVAQVPSANTRLPHTLHQVTQDIMNFLKI